MIDRETKLKILAWPGFGYQKDNPYGFLIYSEIEKAGHSVKEFDLNIREVRKNLQQADFDVFHMHWPRHLLNRRERLRILKNVGIFYFFLKGIHRKGKKIIWTVHNLKSHEPRFPVLERIVMRLVYRMVDGFISMNESGIDEIRMQCKKNTHQKVKYIPHPHYKGYYPDTIDELSARDKLGIKTGEFVFLFLGQIRKYKNVTALAKAFRSISSPAKLVIAGKVHPEMSGILSEVIRGERGIILKEEFIKDGELQDYLRACDLVVLPYRQIFNSGSVFLNLSFAKPTLVPDTGVFKELQEKVGERWVKTFRGELDSSVLEENLRKVIDEKRSGGQPEPDLQQFDPQKVGLSTINFYCEILSG